MNQMNQNVHLIHLGWFVHANRISEASCNVHSLCVETEAPRPSRFVKDHILLSVKCLSFICNYSSDGST